jgi:hypothetical protein
VSVRAKPRHQRLSRVRTASYDSSRAVDECLRVVDLDDNFVDAWTASDLVADPDANRPRRVAARDEAPLATSTEQTMRVLSVCGARYAESRPQGQLGDIHGRHGRLSPDPPIRRAEARETGRRVR